MPGIEDQLEPAHQQILMLAQSDGWSPPRPALRTPGAVQLDADEANDDSWAGSGHDAWIYSYLII